MIKIDPAEPCESEKPKESSDGGDQFLGRVRPSVLRPIEHERPDVFRVPLMGILAQCVEQVSRTATILSEGGGRSASVPLKPFAKRGDEDRLRDLPAEHRLGLAHCGSTEMMVKALGSQKYVVISRSSVRERAPAPWQMAAERLERTPVHIGRGAMTSVKKMPEVRRRPQVSHRAGVRVAIAFESVSKPINVWSARAGAQTGECLRRGKVGL